MIDFRSDTVTKPSLAMREAMMGAEVGDDVYGDDPTINSLESRVAAMFGHEAAVFAPTGSLANQLAIRTLVSHGQELLTDSTAHIVRAELGAGAVFSGITTRTWPSIRGRLVAQDALDLATPNAGPYLVSTTAIAVENTHNFGGGTVQSIEEIKKLRTGADELGLTLHLDGARIWNAHVATGVSFLEYGKYFDTISVCLSKGLGAPVGSIMISNQERVNTARVWRKRYGAGMRQIGILGAAAHYALDNNIPSLVRDHEIAQKISKAIHALNPSLIDPTTVETNIVAINCEVTGTQAGVINAALKENGVLAGALGKYFLRIVTHRDLTDDNVDEGIAKITSTLSRFL
jgi:threonine aldolase